jgi:hypothetical protein
MPGLLVPAATQPKQITGITVTVHLTRSRSHTAGPATSGPRPASRPVN